MNNEQQTHLTDEQIADGLQTLEELKANPSVISCAFMLPVLFRLNDAPYNILDEYYQMEPVFYKELFDTLTLKCARQVSKTTVLGALDILLCATIRPPKGKHFKSLYIAPRFDQTKRFSNEVLGPFLEESPISKNIINLGREQSVLTKHLTNNAIMHLSYAFLSPGRTRGIPSDCNIWDEIQDMDPEFLGIINACMGASPYMLEVYAGTPLTMDNLIETLWQKSSMGEWATKCLHCNYWSIASLDTDLMRMIQKDGLRCGKCGKDIDTINGEYIHRVDSRAATDRGLHIPQAIMPYHYKNPRKWRKLFKSKADMPRAQFLNEICGESCDERSSLLSRTDLIRASTLKHPNTIEAALKAARTGGYLGVSVAVDWGGRGISGVSQTGLVVLGHTARETIDVLYLSRVDPAFDEYQEVIEVKALCDAFRASSLSHDFANSGIREAILIHMGFNESRMFNVRYVSASSGSMIAPSLPRDSSEKRYYSVDRTRSLSLMCALIKGGHYAFPIFDTWEHLSSDFLSLVETRKESTKGLDITLVERKASMSDDIGNATNIASLAWWYKKQKFPNLVAVLKPSITRALEQMMAPEEASSKPTGVEGSPPAGPTITSTVTTIIAKKKPQKKRVPPRRKPKR